MNKIDYVTLNTWAGFILTITLKHGYTFVLYINFIFKI